MCQQQTNKARAAQSADSRHRYCYETIEHACSYTLLSKLVSDTTFLDLGLVVKSMTYTHSLTADVNCVFSKQLHSTHSHKQEIHRN